ncbi:hydrolase [Panacagrimonas perspica]|uniref:hydrolase n=1 Tax=Panacagrimonas perspica TaxID=381431 RepID=UPI001FEA298C|nr:hydrolase [Panacagrimonas perspica]
MNALANPLDWIDAQLPAMREFLVRLADQNSGSFNVAGVNAVGRDMADRFASLGATTEFIDLAPFASTGDDGLLHARPVGRAVRLRKRPEAPLRVFLCGHLDTVYPADSAFQSVISPADDVLRGPGVADLKGGLLAMWAALAALEQSPHRDRIGWEVLLNPDEEIGSASSAALLAEAAARHHLGLVYEPALPDGHLVGARKGSGNFDVVVHGRAAHAGRDFAAGRNALAACARLVDGVNALNGQREGVTINPGYLHGGGALNIVPDLAVFKFNVRATGPDDGCWLHEQLDLLLTRANAVDGISVELRGGFTRPAKPFDERNRRLAALIGDCGRTLGLSLEFKPTGGCCDGNNLHAAGLPNIDNLGVVGGDIHSEREWMRVSSLTERAKLSALLLLRLASGELAWS